MDLLHTPNLHQLHSMQVNLEMIMPNSVYFHSKYYSIPNHWSPTCCFHLRIRYSWKSSLLQFLPMCLLPCCLPLSSLSPLDFRKRLAQCFRICRFCRIMCHPCLWRYDSPLSHLLPPTQKRQGRPQSHWDFPSSFPTIHWTRRTSSDFHTHCIRLRIRRLRRRRKQISPSHPISQCFDSCCSWRFTLLRWKLLQNSRN